MLIKIDSAPTVPFEINNQSFEMLTVVGGRFMRGGEEYDDEKPIRKVEVSSFLMGKYPVTQELWETVMGNNPSRFKGLDRPVEQVSWHDATKFCNVLSEQLGKEQVYKGSGEHIEIDYAANGFRLPTEAEWEYAARGGKHQENYIYAGGNDAHLVAWYRENSHQETKPVGLKPPNVLGLHDMSGNVREWCNDWYGSDYYTESPPSNPKGPKKGTSRVFRGGSWNFDPRIMRVAYRFHYHPEGRYDFIGFRLCLPQF